MIHPTEPSSPSGSIKIAGRPGSLVDTKICIGVATRGRSAQLVSLIRHLSQQTLAPAAIIVSSVDPGDTTGLIESDVVHVVNGPPGLTRQRNAVLDNIPREADFVVFFDDDFYPHDRWLEVVINAFSSDHQLSCVTGNVIADGILGPGLTYDDAVRALQDQSPEDHRWTVENYSPYGCNMAFRRSAIEGLRFDERLVLYGWQEDRDFGARVGREGGRLIQLGSAVGVHLGIKSGRVSGRRLGYSQVANPIYLHSKQTMSAPDVASQMLKNLSANAAGSFRPEPYIDRHGRLIGNLIAFGDFLRGRCSPERAEML